MNKEKIEKTVDDTLLMLYQNKGREAVEKVVSLLELFQNMIENYKGQNYTEVQKDGVELQQKLLKAYKIQDILAMADCLCLLYTSDAADEEDSVDLGGRRII